MRFGAHARLERIEMESTSEIALLGVVNAGQPYAAFSVEDTLNVPTKLWGGKQVFALRVQGSSMIDEGIHHGDYLIVEPRADAENGQTVVAEVDGGVTVKKFYREADGQIRLQPANANMLPLLVPAASVRIVGLVAGILRKCGTLGARPRASTPPVPAASKVTRLPVRYRGHNPPPNAENLELEINALDDRLEKWAAMIERARGDRRWRARVPAMTDLSRDLAALRDWYGRVTRPALRRALIAEANRVMRRMQQLAPDLGEQVYST
jgi:repressor LexA